MNHVPNLRPLADSVIVKKTPSGVVSYWNDSDPLPVRPSDFVFPLVIYGIFVPDGSFRLLVNACFREKPDRKESVLKMLLEVFLLYRASSCHLFFCSFVTCVMLPQNGPLNMRVCVPPNPILEGGKRAWAHQDG